jgi:hypothetical protein
MSNSLSARPGLHMTVLPGEAIGESRRGARSSAALRMTQESARRRAEGDEPEDDPAHYANAGPDCYWVEAS